MLALYQRSNRPKVALLPSSCFVGQHDDRNATEDFHEPNESLDAPFDELRSMRVHCTRVLNMPKETKSLQANVIKLARRDLLSLYLWLVGSYRVIGSHTSNFFLLICDDFQSDLGTNVCVCGCVTTNDEVNTLTDANRSTLSPSVTLLIRT